MNLNTFGVTLFVVGVVLMYGAVKNIDPRDVVLKALGQKPKFGVLAPDVGVGKAGQYASDSGFGAAQSSSVGTARWVSV